MSDFLEHLSMWNMLNRAEEVQVQKYKTHAYQTPETPGVQTIKDPTKQLKKVPIKTQIPYQYTHK